MEMSNPQFEMPLVTIQDNGSPYTSVILDVSGNSAAGNAFVSIRNKRGGDEVKISHEQARHVADYLMRFFERRSF